MISLKGQNVLQIWAVLICDAMLVAGIVHPSIFNLEMPASIEIIRLASAFIAPLMVFVLTSLIPSDMKAVLVFWRWKDVLPGHRAFSVYAPRDPRIDIPTLEKLVGSFPTVPREQNSLWYRLFKKVEGNGAVLTSNRQFLLFRDIASISAMLALAVPTLFAALDVSSKQVAYVAVIFVIQYLATMVSARNHGIRLVTNVLALHSIKRVC